MIHGHSTASLPFKSSSLGGSARVSTLFQSMVSRNDANRRRDSQLSLSRPGRTQIGTRPDELFSVGMLLKGHRPLAPALRSFANLCHLDLDETSLVIVDSYRMGEPPSFSMSSFSAGKEPLPTSALDWFLGHSRDSLRTLKVASAAPLRVAQFIATHYQQLTDLQVGLKGPDRRNEHDRAILLLAAMPKLRALCLSQSRFSVRAAELMGFIQQGIRASIDYTPPQPVIEIRPPSRELMHKLRYVVDRRTTAA